MQTCIALTQSVPEKELKGYPGIAHRLLTRHKPVQPDALVAASPTDAALFELKQ